MSTQLLVEALAPGRPIPDFSISIRRPRRPSSLIKKERPQVAVVSAQLQDPKRGGGDLLRKIRLESPETRVIVLLDFSERNAVTEAFRAGAQGVFCRTEPFQLLAKCIQCVANGQVWANSNEMQFLLQALAEPAFPNCLTLTGGVLSRPRQPDVVRCVAEGPHQPANRGAPQIEPSTLSKTIYFAYLTSWASPVESRLCFMLSATAASSIRCRLLLQGACRRPPPARTRPKSRARSQFADLAPSQPQQSSSRWRDPKDEHRFLPISRGARTGS